MQRRAQAPVRTADDRPGPPIALTAPGALLVALLLGGCAATEEAPPPASVEGVSTGVPGVPCVPPSPLAVAPDPPPVAVPPGAVLTDVTEQAGQRLVTGRVEASVQEVLEHFRRAPSYVVTRDEDEGVAGELVLFGAGGDVVITVAELACPEGRTGFTVATAVRQASPGP